MDTTASWAVRYQEDELLDEQGHADGDEQDADDADELVQGGRRLTLAHGDILLGLQGEAGGVDSAPTRSSRARQRPDTTKAPKQLVAGGLGDGVGLAGDEGLVDLHLAGRTGVAWAGIWSPEASSATSSRTSWAAGTEIRFPSRTTLARGAAAAGCSLSTVCLERSLLNDANAGIGHGDEQKEHVVEGARRHQQGRQHHEDRS